MKKREKGSALYFTVVVMAVVLGVALGMTAVLFNQLRMAREIGNSVAALYAADTGIEEFLWEARKGMGGVPIGSPTELEEMENGAKFWVEVDEGIEGTACDEEYFYCVRAVGRYMGVQRAIYVDF